MPRRKARIRNTFRMKFMWRFADASHSTHVKFLRRIACNIPQAREWVERCVYDPDLVAETYDRILRELGPREDDFTIQYKKLMAAERARTAAETDKTPLSPHDAHGPLNSQTHAGWHPASEPSAESSAEEPPRPRVLYL